MEKTPELYDAILKAETLPQTCLLLSMFKVEHPGLTELWTRVATGGLKLKFHFRELLEREDFTRNHAHIGNRKFNKWEYWEELDERMSLAKEAMLTILDEDDDPLTQEEEDENK